MLAKKTQLRLFSVIKCFFCGSLRCRCDSNLNAVVVEICWLAFLIQVYYIIQGNYGRNSYIADESTKFGRVVRFDLLINTKYGPAPDVC